MAAPTALATTSVAPARRRRGAALTAAAVIVAVAIGVGAYELTSGGGGNGGAGPAAATKSPPSLIPPRFTGRWRGTLQNQNPLKGSRNAVLTVTKATADGKAAGTGSYTDAGDGLIPADNCKFAFRLASATAAKLTLREIDTTGGCPSEYLVLTGPPSALTARVYGSNPSAPDNSDDPFGGPPGPTYTGRLSHGGAS